MQNIIFNSLNINRPQKQRQWWINLAISMFVGILGAAPMLAQAPFNPPPPPQTAPPTALPVAAQGSTIKPSTPTPAATTAPSTLAALATPREAPTTPVTSKMRPMESGEIVARVDGQVVLASDVLWQVNRIIAANADRIPPSKLAEAKRVFMRQQVMGLIDTKMLFADFRQTVPPEGFSQIEENLREPFEEREIPRLMKALDLKDRNELVKILKESGASLSDVRRQFNERTIAGEWLRQKTPAPKEVTHQDMLDYYKEHKEDYAYPAQVKWEEVMISFDRLNNDRTKAWQAITGLGNEAWQQAAKQPGLRGPIFTEIAKRKSHGFTAKEGGQHDWTTKGAMRSKDINEALYSLKIGQLSDVIETERGFHIVRVLDRKEEGYTPFTEAQKMIRDKLGKKQRQGLAQAELAKLRKKSRVWTVFDGDINAEELAKDSQQTRRR